MPEHGVTSRAKSVTSHNPRSLPSRIFAKPMPKKSKVDINRPSSLSRLLCRRREALCANSFATQMTRKKDELRMNRCLHRSLCSSPWKCKLTKEHTPHLCRSLRSGSLLTEDNSQLQEDSLPWKQPGERTRSERSRLENRCC